MMICIHNGLGAGQESITQTSHMFRELAPQYEIRIMSDRETIDGDWTEKASLLVMPGGADLPYVAKLKGKGNETIKNFVAGGGSYLGICAGAYYGSAYVEFDKGGTLQVLGERELGFYRGKAVGPLLAPYDYQSNSGARAARLHSKFSTQPVHVYFNGGSYFEHLGSEESAEILAEYDTHPTKKLPAIIKTTHGKGTVVLSGVHFEFSPELLDQNDPHLQSIIPALKKDSQNRKNFIREILRNLQLKV